MRALRGRSKKLVLEVEEFSGLLAAAETPRDRMVLSLGLLLFLRPEEISDLRVGDMDLDGGVVRVTRKLSLYNDSLPISKELDKELRHWLDCYTRQVGELKSDYYLVPARRMGRVVFDPKTDSLVRRDEPIETLYPTKMLKNPTVIVGRVLKGLGYPTFDVDSGKPYHLGMTVLRRSGARAFLWNLTDKGCTDALQIVRVMLRHNSVVMTEAFLGIEVERYFRTDLLRGQLMFPGMHELPD